MPTGLQDKLRQRHVDAVSAFQSAMTQTSAEMDNRIVAFLVRTRDALQKSRASSTELVQRENQRLQQRDNVLSLAESQLAALPLGAVLEALPGDDALHGFTESSDARSIEAVSFDRSRRITVERGRLINCFVQLRDWHVTRLATLDEVEAFLRRCECERRDELRTRMQGLQVQLSTVAYVGVPEAQVLVQRAALDANKRLLQNDVDGTKLVADLRAHEFYFQKQTLTNFCATYEKSHQWMADMTIAWSKSVLCSSAYRQPSARRDCRQSIGAALRQSKKDVGFAVAGLHVMLDTLQRRPEVRDNDVGDAPGGTDPQNGWLRSFVASYDMSAKPKHPFSDDPEVAQERLRVSIEVLIDQVREWCERSLSQLQGDEEAMLSSLRAVMAAMLRDVTLVFTPTKEEISAALACGRSRENSSPIDATVVEDPTTAQAKIQKARAATDTTIELIEFESKSFAEAVAVELFHHSTELTQSFFSRGGILPILFDATTYLYTVTSKVVMQHRSALHTQFERQKDYEDALYRLECDFAAAEAAVAHAGTVGQAGRCFETALGLLKSIQALHCSNHDTRIALMQPQTHGLQESFKEAEGTLMASLNVASLEFVIAHNNQEASAAAAATAAAPVTKGASKSAPAKAAPQGKEPPPAASSGPTSNRIPVEVLERIDVGGGKTYVVLKPQLKFGQFQETRASSAGSVSAVPNKDTAAPAGSKPGGKAAAAKTAAAKGTAATSPNNDDMDSSRTSVGGTPSGGGGALQSLQPERRVFLERVRNELSSIFPSDCLLSSDAPAQLTSAVRAMLLRWLADNEANIIARLKGFFEKVKTELDTDTNDRIRIHYRRAPTLQTHVYDTRIRELDDATQSREKYFSWLNSRVENANIEMSESILRTWPPVEQAVKSVTAMRQGLPAILSSQGLGSQIRAVADQTSKAAAHAEETLSKVLQTGLTAYENVMRECQTYAAERLKTFDEGGNLSPSEAAAAHADCKAIEDAATKAAADAKDLVEEAVNRQRAALEAERNAFNVVHALHVAEVNFLRRVSELLGSAKTKISGLLTTSASAATRIEEAVHTIEQLTTTPLTAYQKELPRLVAFAALDLDSPVTTPLPTWEDQIAGPVDAGTWQGDDVIAAALLRRSRVVETSLLPKSKAAALLTALDDLRKQLYARGVSLGALAFGAEFGLISPEGYFDAKKANASGSTLPADGDPGSAKKGAAAAASGGGAKGGKGKAGATAVADTNASASTSATGATLVDDPYRFMKVTKLESEAARLLASAKEQLVATIQAYFKEAAALAGAPSPLLLHRADLYGSDASSITKTVQARLTEQEKRIAEHVVDAAKMYKDQLHRVSILLYRVAPEIFASIVNASIEAADLRIGSILSVFSAFVLDSWAARRHHQSELKASMGAPVHNERLKQLLVKESTRHSATVALCHRAQGALLGELQDAAHLCASRCAQALTVLFMLTKSIVSVDHVGGVAGVDDVLVNGDHRSIKRLLRLRQREEAARALEGAAATSTSNPAAANAKGTTASKSAAATKPDPKKPGAKSGKKGAGELEDDTAFPPLERPMQEYAGLVLNAVRCFESWRKGHMDVALKMYEAAAGRLSLNAGDTDVAEPVSQAPKGKPPPKPTAKTAAKGAPDSAAHDASGGADSTPVAAPIVSPPIQAPRDRLHQGAWLTRQQASDVFSQAATKASDMTDGRVSALVQNELSWAAAWKAAVSELQRGM